MDLTKKIKKIDLHAHPHFSGGPERLRGGTWPTPHEVREVYDRLNIESAVIMSRYAPERMHDPITSRDCEMMHKQYPDLFPWWFCALDPRMAWNDTRLVPDYSYYIDFYRERGARGVGEVQANMYIDDPRMLALIYHCDKKKFPITIHFGNIGIGCGVCADDNFSRLEKVLEDYPNLRLLGHANFWNFFSSGRVAELMRKFPGIMCDISAGSGYDALSQNLEYTYEFIDEFYERIVFATDISSPESQKVTAAISNLVDDAYKSGNISATAYKCICRENALRLFNDQA